MAVHLISCSTYYVTRTPTVVEETRSDINQKHDLADVMFLVLSAIMPDAEGWQDIKTYGDHKLPWLRKFRPFEHSIPR